MRFDIAVVGGGASGVAAALGASAQGASVVLVEENPLPGGLAAHAQVGTVCGLYASDRPGFEYNCGKFAQNFAQKLQKRSGSLPEENQLALKYLPYDPKEFAVLCNDLLSASGVVVLQGKVTRAAEKEGKITTLHNTWANNLQELQIGAVVDASGVSVVSKLLNQPLIDWEFRQSVSQVFTLHHLEFSNEQNLSLVLMKALRKGSNAGLLDPGDERCSIVPGSLKAGQASLKITVAARIDTEESEKALKAECMERIGRIVDFLVHYEGGFSTVRLLSVAPSLGIRIGDRAVGHRILRAEDVLEARKSEDFVARGNWPVEIWNESRQVEIQRLPKGEYYDIPMACLRSASLHNLYFAGRCISATDRAIASARVIGTCLQSGYAAGMFAALQLQNKSEYEAVRMIQEEQFAP